MKDFIKGCLFIIFISSGIGHFASTELYMRLVPPYIPFPKEVVLASGVAVILMALGMLWPRVSKFTARVMIAFLLATLPTVLYIVSNASLFPEISPQALAFTVPLQLAMFVGAWRISHLHSPVYFFAKWADPDFAQKIDEDIKHEDEEEIKDHQKKVS